MEVRRAEPADLTSLGRLTQRAWRVSYRGLLADETIESILEHHYSPTNLARSIAAGQVWVAAYRDDTLGYAEALLDDEAITLTNLCTDPSNLRQGVGRALVHHIRDLDGRLPVCADVLLGNLAGEAFYERLGFVPGETVEHTMGEQAVVERRWWLGADQPVAAIVPIR